jgi:PAS domain S-box-containing protein
MTGKSAGRPGGVRRRTPAPAGRSSRNKPPSLSKEFPSDTVVTACSVSSHQKKIEPGPEYRRIFEALDGMVYVCSRDYHVEYMNDLLIARTGYDGTGQYCYKVLHDRDSVCPWCVNERVFEGETVCWEVRSPKDNRWLYVVNTPLRHSDGSLSKHSLFLDITASRQLSEQLRQREEEFRTLAENSPDIISRYDTGLRLLYVNRDPLKNGEFSSIGKTWREMGFPEEYISVWEPLFRKVVASGKAETFEHVHRTPDTGGIVCLSSRITPEFDAAGKVRSVLVITSDVTALKRSRETLERHKEYYKSLVDNSVDIIIRLDKDLRFSYCSPSVRSIAGKPPEHYLGKSVLEGIKVFDSSRLYELGKQAMKNNEPVTQELAFGEGAAKKYFKVSFVPERGKDGKVVSGIVCIRDITDMKKAEEVLQRDNATLERLVHEGAKELLKAQSEVEKSRRLSDIGVLASTIAHEIRNPLAAMKTAAYNIGRKADDDRFDRHLATINKKVMECDLIIQNLLNYSRMKEPMREQVLLAPLLNECMDNILSKYATWNVGVVRKLHLDATLAISADPTQLKILFSNLLDNAFQSLVEKLGQVSLEATVEHGRVRVDIRDTGAGIDENDLSKIFEPFFTRKSRGTGLGLPISRQIVELHNGTLSVTSVRYAGTSVRVTLPLKIDR